uniref:Uncharacterized protein n=1 Tax=Eptatretus burgeri TaxID=7764 RepID=A0A8C4QQI5_EPTBU
MHFCLQKSPPVEFLRQSQPLLLHNTTAVPLSIELSLPEPFGLLNDVTGKLLQNMNLQLQVGGSAAPTVTYTPRHLPGGSSQASAAQLVLSFGRPPREHVVHLSAEFNVPELEFPETVVDFGCIANGTEVERKLLVRNVGPLPAPYSWSFRSGSIRYTAWVCLCFLFLFLIFLVCIVKAHIKSCYSPPAALSLFAPLIRMFVLFFVPS